MILAYACTFDRAVSLLQRLSSTSRNFLINGGEKVLMRLCHCDYDERTMMECVKTVKPLKVLAEEQKFDI
jgi:hypothetical protein